MVLYYNCTNCKVENRLKTDCQNRVEFAMKNGKFKIIHCQDCKKEKTIFINNIYAKESKWLRIIAIFILFIGTTIGIYFLWDMILSGKSKTGIYATAIGLQIPMWIYIILKAEDRRRVRTFNQSYVKESYR